ncbi:PRD domain-containing protein [Sporolactobacillus sp. THM7-7]|nr:PRD domain-containing protein [Sporolactobacillus sp. THM7-7]
MLEETEKKLNVLKSTNKIDEQTLVFIKKVDEYLQEETGYVNNGMLLMHLAIAIARARENNSIDKMPDIMRVEMENSQYFRRANNIWTLLENDSPVKLNHDEVQYIILHIIT